MAICDGHGLPLAVYVASASPAEVRLVEETSTRGSSKTSRRG
jgi:hypothetical protein